MTVMEIVEKNVVPDAVIRYGIRKRLKRKLKELNQRPGDPSSFTASFARELQKYPIAIHAQDANRQHYELPPVFFEAVLGPRLKYSSAYWTPHTKTLAQAEEEMLRIVCSRSEIEDGQSILDLGCGLGSLTLHLGQCYPHSRILGLSNSNAQREFILTRARERGLNNIEVITSDINDFESGARFQRVISIEMFEHMKNYQLLLAKIARFLDPGGRLFVHVFSHRQHAYHYEAAGEGDWMARHFFTGGLMPSDDLLPCFQGDLHLLEHWRLSGMHYKKTAEAWLANLDAHRPELRPVLERIYGREGWRLWWGRWRIFFMACAELFGYADGTEWGLSHYVFRRP